MAINWNAMGNQRRNKGVGNAAAMVIAMVAAAVEKEKKKEKINKMEGSKQSTNEGRKEGRRENKLLTLFRSRTVLLVAEHFTWHSVCSSVQCISYCIAEWL